MVKRVRGEIEVVVEAMRLSFVAPASRRLSGGHLARPRRQDAPEPAGKMLALQEESDARELFDSMAGAQLKQMHEGLKESIPPVSPARARTLAPTYQSIADSAAHASWSGISVPLGSTRATPSSVEQKLRVPV